jgi:hypothetical protein
MAFVPTFVSIHAEQSARTTIAALAQERGSVLRAQRELNGTAAAIGRIADFDRQRTSATLLLAQLSDALPTGSALTTVKMDSTGGLVIGLGPHASDIVRAIGTIPGLTHVEILGSVTREMTSSAAMERVTVRFSGRPEQSRARVPLPASRVEKLP